MHNLSMLRSTELIIDNHLNDHIIRECDLAFLFGGTSARRYALVNKAIKKGELIRLHRGYYTLPYKYQQKKTLAHFYIANRIIPFSFISCESALSFHNLIPERVTQINSIAPFGRNKKFEISSYGIFNYYVPPISPEFFYAGVKTIEENNQIVYIATPLRALVDYVHLRKVENANVHFLENSLRVEEEDIQKITRAEITALQSVYHSRYVMRFLQNLLDEL